MEQPVSSLSSVSSREPNGTFTRSKRALILSSAMLLLFTFVGVEPSDTVNSGFLSLKIANPQYIPYVVLAFTVYYLSQFLFSWQIQTAPVKQDPANKADYEFNYYIAVGSMTLFLGIHVGMKIVLPAITPTLSSIFTSIHFGSLNGDILKTLGNTISFVAPAIGIIAASKFLQETISKWIRRVADIYSIRSKKIAERLVNGEWFLCFSPVTENGKVLSFLATGEIGKGQNDNEHKWQINLDLLEILDSAGAVFSRFSYDEETNQFRHTNDEDTLSIKDQFILPLSSAHRLGLKGLSYA